MVVQVLHGGLDGLRQLLCLRPGDEAETEAPYPLPTSTSKKTIARQCCRKEQGLTKKQKCMRYEGNSQTEEACLSGRTNVRKSTYSEA
eukprot:CAMPEP_0183375824 /NCGR_PEP_ID=MMETSP0164_2-20130417/118539_1 /TAXON_ID=221442 /ORGANISM="Coccolithus pelagicus ssp braarudi, Strain PLY182g" /LENGTH=87 /DNA_ID=CAMNT_0025553041 /DNA_START=18 /DNA_END=278 /DNA_ORIENTATION=+